MAKHNGRDSSSGSTDNAAASTSALGIRFWSATFQSDETVNGESNGSNSEAEEGEPGLEGTIDIEPGDRMPFVPRHMIKAFADVRITDALFVDVDVVGVSGSFARGNENNEHEPDGTYYLNEGTSPGYAVVNSERAIASPGGCR